MLLTSSASQSRSSIYRAGRGEALCGADVSELFEVEKILVCGVVKATDG